MKLQLDGSRCLVRFEIGEKLPAALVELARAQGWTSASLTGLGAVAEVTLGHYDLVSKQYHTFSPEGIVELVSLIGNLSLLDGAPLWHLHALVADREGRVIGGHLMSLTVAVTVECWIDIGTRTVIRKLDEHTGLNLLDL